MIFILIGLFVNSFTFVLNNFVIIILLDLITWYDSKHFSLFFWNNLFLFIYLTLLKFRILFSSVSCKGILLTGLLGILNQVICCMPMAKMFWRLVTISVTRGKLCIIRILLPLSIYLYIYISPSFFILFSLSLSLSLFLSLNLSLILSISLSLDLSSMIS